MDKPRRLEVSLRKRRNKIGKQTYSWQVSRSGRWDQTFSSDFWLWRAAHIQNGNLMLGIYYSGYANGYWFSHSADAKAFYHFLETIRIKHALYEVAA